MGQDASILGETDEKGDMHTAVEKGSFVAGHARSMIGKEENYGILSQAILFQLFEDFPHLPIHSGYAVMETGHGFLNNGRIRVVGGIFILWG